MFSGCVLETSKDNHKALSGLTGLAQIVSIFKDGNANALLEAAKSIDYVELKVLLLFFFFFFLLTYLRKYTFTGSYTYNHKFKKLELSA